MLCALSVRFDIKLEVLDSIGTRLGSLVLKGIRKGRDKSAGLSRGRLNDRRHRSLSGLRRDLFREASHSKEVEEDLLAHGVESWAQC